MKEYRNDRIAVRFDLRVCIHSAECIAGLPQVLDVRKRPWINVNGADADSILRQMARRGRCRQSY